MALAAALSSGMGFVPAFASQPRVVQAPAKAATPGKRGLFNDMPLSGALGLYGPQGRRHLDGAAEARRGEEKPHHAQSPPPSLERDKPTPALWPACNSVSPSPLPSVWI
jgi:hypothetical protein